MPNDFHDTIPALMPSDTMDARNTESVHDSYYRQIFEAAGVGIALISSDGHYLDVNERYAQICQRDRHQLLGLACMTLAHPDDLPVKQALMDATLLGHQSHFAMDLRYLTPKGDEIWVQSNTVLIRDDAGLPRHFVTVVEDISERKRYQEALLSAQAAERASKAKTEFLSRMSHELRTPLNAMLGFAQLLRLDTKNTLQTSQLQKVRYIEEAGGHLLAMLTDVLDLSRIEAGHLPLSPEALCLHDVAQEAMHLVLHAASTRRIAMHVRAIDPAWCVHADRVRLRQVLVNLLSNAIKYNHPNGEVWLNAERGAAYISISIKDSGKGLNPEQQAHLFEPFNRLGAENTEVEGTGIGLVIVNRLIKLMHGRIDVQSEMGAGSVFTISLPIAPHLPAHALHAPPAITDQASDEGPLFQLLYAEDNPVNIELLRHVMNMRPRWQLKVATCGADTIEMVRSHPPDLLLLDMHLGDMGGLDVSDALMNHAPSAQVARVALSADVMPDQVKAAKERQFLAYLTKPLNIAQLFKLLDEQEAELMSKQA